MKKTLVMFGLMAASMFSCKKEPPNHHVISVDSDALVSSMECIVEVPCKEPELEAVGLNHARKFYNFCKNTVTIISMEQQSAGQYSWGGPLMYRQSFDALDSIGRAEKDEVFKKYQSIQLKK